MPCTDLDRAVAAALLRAAAPPASLLAELGPQQSLASQEHLAEALRACPHAPDARYVRRLVDAVLAAPREGGDDDSALLDSLCELLARAEKQNALGTGGFVSLFLHPALDAPDSDRCWSVARPLISVWRSAHFSDVSTVLWPAALQLADLVGLAVWPAPATAADSSALLLARWRRLWCGVRVLELGSGTGVAGLCLASLSRWAAAAGCGSGGLSVEALTLTDGDARSVEVMRANANSNAMRDVQCPRLHWGDAFSAGADVVDAVIGSDVVYDPTAVAALVATVSALLQPQRRAPSGTATAPRDAAPSSLAAALDVICGTPTERRPFAFLVNTWRSAATYATFEAALNSAGCLSWLDATSELQRLGNSRPVLDLRLPRGSSAGSTRAVLVWAPRSANADVGTGLCEARDKMSHKRD